MRSIHRAKVDGWHVKSFRHPQAAQWPPTMTKRNTRPAIASGKKPKPLRLGFVPLTDCAPLVMARELGLFAKHGLHVVLKRELGWATIRDKIIYGELDAAHSVAGIGFAATFGLGSIPCPCVTGLVLNLHGNAITLSRELWESGVRDAKTLREAVVKSRNRKVFTFGAVFPFSSHNFLLRQWLAGGGIDPDRDVRIVVVPPPQMAVNLEAGHLDGYCVGEPWNSVAVHREIGWCAATSAQLAPGHPEKVLLVRRRFAEERASEHLALVAALLEACAFCDRPENAGRIISSLDRPEYLNRPAGSFAPSLGGLFDFGFGRVESVPDFHVFHRRGANDPSPDKAAWIMRMIVQHGLAPNRSVFQTEAAREIFRPDIFRAARQLAGEAGLPEDNIEAENGFTHV